MVRPLHVLLVEDEPIDAMTLKRVLRRRDLCVDLEVVESAEAALDALRGGRVPKATLLPDLILADLMLPRLSGLDLLERVKADQALRQIPFVMLSTSTQESDVAAAYCLGATGYFVKSVVFDEFADTIEAIIDFCGRAEPSARTAVASAWPLIFSETHYLQSELRKMVREDPGVFDFLGAGATDGLWYWDLERPEHEWMSAGFWSTFGYESSAKPHLASAWQDLIDPGDLETAVVNLRKHCDDPQYPYDQVVRYLHRDGGTVWIRCRGVAIRDSAGKAIRMLGAHTDVTERERSRERAEAAEEKLRQIAKAMTDDSVRDRHDVRLHLIRAILAEFLSA